MCLGVILKNEISVEIHAQSSVRRVFLLTHDATQLRHWKLTRHKSKTYSYNNTKTFRKWRVFQSRHFYNQNIFFDVLLTVHFSIFISVINQLDAQNFCFTISLFHASTCFKHMCSSSGGQNCIIQPLVSSYL